MAEAGEVGVWQSHLEIAARSQAAQTTGSTAGHHYAMERSVPTPASLPPVLTETFPSLSSTQEEGVARV